MRSLISKPSNIYKSSKVSMTEGISPTMLRTDNEDSESRVNMLMLRTYSN